MTEAKQLGAPYELVRMVAGQGKLPVPNFAAGGIATPGALGECEIGAAGVRERPRPCGASGAQTAAVGT